MELGTPDGGKTRRTLERLFRMGLPELVCRGKQEAFKRIERVSAFAARRSGHHVRKAAEGFSHRDRESRSRFLRNAEEHFFEGAFDRLVPTALALQSPNYCRELVTAADEICLGRFELLGYCSLDFGDPPRWNFDPISGCHAPFVHWSRLDTLDYATIGDSKVIWELNRHQWMVHLGEAYQLTREQRYAEAVVRYLESWLRANPPGMGINWTSSLEVAFRLISWCWALLLIRDSEVFTPTLFAQLMESVKAHAAHIERYLSYYFSPNTHLTGEALGLLYASVVFPELRRAEHWRSLGNEILIQEIERQVLSDGVYFERSTCYQHYTLDIYLHFMILAARAGIEVPAVVSERVHSMLDFLVAVSNPDGSIPNIGDSDGGALLPLSKIEPNNFRATFSTAAVLFKSPTYASAAGELAPDTIWLLGSSALEIFEELEPSPPASDGCRMFPTGGFAVMRSGSDVDSHSLIFDGGPLGCPISSGHGHADLLSIQCSLFGQRYLVDAGTCCYTANSELRDFSRGTAAHSTVMVDGEGQAQPAGSFGWRNHCAAQLGRWISNETLAFADAEHDAYRALPDPVTHRRRVIFVKPRYWLLIDDLTGNATHRIDIRFQFAPMDIRIDSSGWVRATLDGRQGLMMRAFAAVTLDADVREGRRNPLEGWISPNYGQLEPAPTVVYSATTALPQRVVTLLWPSQRIHEEMPEVDVIRENHCRPIGRDFPELGETVMFEDDEPVVKHDRPSYAMAGLGIKR